MSFRRMALSAGLTLGQLLLASALQAQVGFDLTAIARTGDPARAARALVSASAPSLNDNGQVAFGGDGAVFLSSGGQLAVVAGYGDPAPPDTTFVWAVSPSLNAAGQVVFQARFSPVSPTTVTGLYVFGQSGISKIVIDGDPAPGGEVYVGANSPALNAGGEVAFLSFTGQSSVHLFSAGSFTQLARAGRPAPGGGTFSLFNPPSINGGGQVAFSATFSSPSGSGVYLASGGTITSIARSGDPAPGGGSFQDFGLQAVSLNDAADIAFAATVAPSRQTGIFLFANGQITRLAGEGDPAPGGGNFGTLDSPSLNGSGQVAFRARLSTGGVGVFLFADGDVSTVVRPGDGSPEGDTFVSASAPSLNGMGQIAFEGGLATQLGGLYLFSQGQISRIAGQGDGVDRDPVFWQVFPLALNGNTNVVLSAGMFPGGFALLDETLGAIVRQGDPAPGGGVFRALLDVAAAAMNDNRQVAFTAELNTRDAGLFLFDGGVLTRLAVEGDPAPGGGTFLNVDEPSINSAGQVSFSGTVSAPGRSGIFLFSGGQVTALVQAGDPAPGGGTFSSVLSPSLNDPGQVGFSGGVTAPGRSGMFLWSGGNVSVIVRTGDPAPGGGTFQFSDPFPFSGPSLNASGQAAFTADLSTFGSGVFLFSSGSFVRVAASGDPVPGGGMFNNADAPALNSVGQVAFEANVSPPGGLGIYFFSEGTLSIVARRGHPAPGGGTFRNAGLPSINAQGQVAFLGSTIPGAVGAFLATPQ